jgi:tRNA pseudouridine32 synthase/23S rRNA pseudouridine746 synthase
MDTALRERGLITMLKSRKIRYLDGPVRRYGSISPGNLPDILAAARDLLIINKPQGLAVHAGPRTPHSLEDLLPAYGRPAFRPVAVHRLDRDTSGCLAIAISRRGARLAQAAFADGRVEKLYWAVLDTLPAADEGVIDAAVAKRSTAAAGWRMVVDAGGQAATTAWAVIDRATRLVAFHPHTGRTHQIRVHAAHIGCPIAGDPVYGAGVGPMRLHARALTISLPDGQRLAAQAPPPPGWPNGCAAESQ